ncbi:hypothetical protein PMAYCL1PPCAC_23352, partial [Pristionchus mayeri]
STLSSNRVMILHGERFPPSSPFPSSASLWRFHVTCLLHFFKSCLLFLEFLHMNDVVTSDHIVVSLQPASKPEEENPRYVQHEK